MREDGRSFPSLYFLGGRGVCYIKSQAAWGIHGSWVSQSGSCSSRLETIEASGLSLLHFLLSPVSPTPSWCAKFGDLVRPGPAGSWGFPETSSSAFIAPSGLRGMAQMVTVRARNGSAFAMALLSRPQDGEPWDGWLHAWLLILEGKEEGVCVSMSVSVLGHVLTSMHTLTMWKASFLLSPWGLLCWWFQLFPAPLWWKGSDYAFCWVSVFNCRDVVTTNSPWPRLS